MRSERAWNDLFKRPASLIIACALTSAGALSHAADAPPTAPAKADEIAALIRQLGDSRYKVRDAAEKKLIEIGWPAVVEEAEKALASDDFEVRLRARRVLDALADDYRRWATKEVLGSMLWRRTVRAEPVRLAAGGEGVLWLGDKAGALCGLDARSGKERWKSEASAFVADEPTVYLLDKGGRLRAVNVLAGAPKPALSVPAESLLAAAEGVVYVSDSPRVGMRNLPSPKPVHLRALDGKTGKCKWQAEVPNAIGLGPVVADATAFVFARDGQLLALDARTGGKRWSFAESTDPAYWLTAAAGKVFFLRGGRMWALDGATGKKLWTVDGMSTSARNFRPCDRMRLVDGVLYGQLGGSYVAVKAETGRIIWRHRPEVDVPDKAAVRRGQAGRIVVVGGARIRLGVDARPQRSIAEAGDLSQPAVADGVMYFTGPDGLHAVDLRSRQVLWKLAEKKLLPLRPLIVSGAACFAGASESGGAGGGKGTFVVYALKLPGRAWRIGQAGGT